MTGSPYMRHPLTIRTLAPAEYDTLLTHCTTCTWCRENPKTECTRAGVLRRRWSAAGRAARSGSGSR
ncbi:hypothetical protein ACFWFF_01655 [Streptomyces sp. NPDC060223]|uniref:hypothetical protein n=1 Tax=unclassified Streptomyces TaxID=2593676 RepID=UPI003627553D